MTIEATTEPDSCRHCDVPQRMHCQRYVVGIGRHGYVAPTDAQRLARMLGRRNARSAA